MQHLLGQGRTWYSPWVAQARVRQLWAESASEQRGPSVRLSSTPWPFLGPGLALRLLFVLGCLSY